MIYNIRHCTTYKYKYPVSMGNHVACLKPRTFTPNVLLENEIRIEPTPKTITERVDYFGNRLTIFTVQEPHQELVIEARSKVATSGGPEWTSRATPPWEESARSLADDASELGLDAYQFQFESPRIRIRKEFAE